MKDRISDKQNHLYKCSGGPHIAQVFVCDEEIDCPGKKETDEANCRCVQSFVQTEPDLWMCKTLKFPSEAQCSLLYNQTKENICLPYGHKATRDEKLWMQSNGHEKYSNKSKTMAMAVRHKGMFDFTDDRHCKERDKLPCLDEHSTCFKFGDICVYRLDEGGHLAPCVHATHLEYCVSFDCNLMYKCPKFYCIPWEYVCNGRWDCPGGFDEKESSKCGITDRCNNMFKCKRSFACLHLGNVCDNTQNCPFGDDEILCHLQSFHCPAGCDCLALAILCVKKSLELACFSHVMPFTSVSVLMASDFWQSNSQLLGMLSWVSHLTLVGTNIAHICNTTSSWAELVLLQLEYNKIKQLTLHCFSNNKYLISIGLGNNRIQNVASRAFVHLPNLRIIKLDNNRLTSLPSEMCYGIWHIDTISLLGNSVEHLDRITFSQLDIKVFVADQFLVCCAVPKATHCKTSKKAWYFSCYNLLPTVALRYIFISASLLLIILNVGSLSIHLAYFKESKSFSVIIIAISSTDIFCTLFVTVLTLADLHYSNSFYANELTWRSSIPCFAVFSLVLCFTLCSPVLLLILSLGRIMVVMKPFDTKFKKAKFTSSCVVCTSVPICIVSIAAAIVIKAMSGKLPFSLCLPFVDPSDSPQVIFKIAIWAVIFLQLFASLSIIFLYFTLFSLYSESQAKLQKDGKRSDMSLAVQLVAASLSNIICWFPTSGIFIASQFPENYSLNMVIWTVIAGMPINSIINPIIFVTTTMRKIKRKKTQLPGISFW